MRAVADREIDVRCPTCRKLLGVRLGSWAVEARNGRNVVALVRHGALMCSGCGQSVIVHEREPLEKLELATASRRVIISTRTETPSRGVDGAVVQAAGPRPS